MGNSIADNALCSGCGVCRAVCPKEAIEMKVDRKGFFRPVVGEKCIDCGLCVKHCHDRGVYNTSRVRRAYTAFSKNADVRGRSSSGGVFSELATAVMDEAGFVCAAGFDDGMKLRHSFVYSPSELDKVRRSKYLESSIFPLWKGLERLIGTERDGLFVGTPCQCAAFRAFLGQKAESVLICDFICHGVASPEVFERFIAHLEKHFGAMRTVEFRHKENGEGSYFLYEGERGRKLIPNYTASYPYAYATGLIVADQCTDCKYCSMDRASDITLGDYVAGEADYNKSTIFANTEKGVRFLEKLEGLSLAEESLEKVAARSWHLTAPNAFNPAREKFFREFRSLDWDAVERKYFRPAGKFETYLKAVWKKFWTLPSSLFSSRGKSRR